jgi:hypothetical protein
MDWLNWPTAFLLSVGMVCATGLTGWYLYLKNRFSDEGDD